MFDTTKVSQSLKDFNFRSLFIEELGWDRYDAGLNVFVDGQNYSLKAVAEKRGMIVFTYQPKDDGAIPDYAMRRKLERQVTKSAHEHIIIYIDSKGTRQIWQWVKREPGKPTSCREHHYYSQQTGEALIQKLRLLVITLEEEELISLPEVTGRARAAFDVDRVTRRFYDRFKTEHAAFLNFIEGIPDNNMERWYASVMLNRLMFIYFVQKKDFLDKDPNYLRNRLSKSKSRGKDRYYTEFLCPLFFEGFAKKKNERSETVNELLGEIPYLNGGIFQRHQIEELHGETIKISDSAFEKLFAFFEQYQWHLDERPLRADNEINPDVLGYIFEKYINQKQMGAYYTKEDITEYIGKNTIVPYLFDAAEKKCKIAFEGENSFWRLLQEDPDRYIYDAVRRGVVDRNGEIIPESTLPEFVQTGMHDPKARMFDKRYNLTEASLPDEDGNNLTLPTETWREYVERRKRCLELREKLTRGEVRNINDLITYNLNIRQFAQDVIENCEGPELLRAFWHAINGRIPEKSNENFEYGVTVLDPACGSGAFLFAALNILEPFYEACLQRMETFLGELEQAEEPHRPEKYSDFRKILSRVEEHPNRRYFILKSIIVNNLFGVDIMEEAVEICKLRMFLKLVAQIDDVNLIEPLPDIDFNIRAGNSLVGFTALNDVKKAVEGDFIKKQSLPGIVEKAELADAAFRIFRRQQTALGGDVSAQDKTALQGQLKELEDELNQFLATEYGIQDYQEEDYSRWLKSHKPFHWFIEFYGIMRKGGFDAIIGNPPYLEKNEVDYQSKSVFSLKTNAIHAIFIESSISILHKNGCMSMIVPMSLPSTQRMKIAQQLIEDNRNAWYSNYAWRPAKLFYTVNRALTIFVINPSTDTQIYSTNYQKWTSNNRESIFSRLHYVSVPRNRSESWVPKLGTALEINILEKCLSVDHTIKDNIGYSQNRIYYRTTGGLYWKVFTDFAPIFRLNGRDGHSSRETNLKLKDKKYIKPTISVLSSNLFWWWYTITSNLRDLNPYDIQNFPLSLTVMKDEKIQNIGLLYLEDISHNSITQILC